MSSLVDVCRNTKEFKGNQPSAEGISKKIKDYVYGEFIGSYTSLIQNMLPSDVVEYTRKKLGEYDISIGKILKKPSFVSDEDLGISGAVGNACAFIRPGKKGAPLRIIMAHTDIPCLKINSQPIYMEADAVLSYTCPQLYLATTPFGGIREEDWYGLEVNVQGVLFKKGLKEKVSLPGRIKNMSIHVDSLEPKGKSALKIALAEKTLEEVYTKLGIMDSMDFGRAELYAYPVPQGGINGRLVGNAFGGIGHDDRSCYWAAMEAGLKSMTSESDNTMIIFGLDREEIGSTSNSGAYRGFFETVLKETLKVILEKDYKNLDLTSELNRSLLGKYPAISADVDVALGNLEIGLSEKEINHYGGAKTGWGFYIAGYDSGWDLRRASPRHIDALMELFDSNLGKTPRKRYHIVDSINAPDSDCALGTMADKFDGILPIIDMGVPVIGLHSPLAEEVNIFDLYWTKEAYGMYLRAKE